MIDAVWLLWSRARVDYARAATIWLLNRMRSGESAQVFMLPAPEQAELEDQR
jgi:hypothetical protein